MRKAIIDVQPGKIVGRIKKLNGANLAPPITTEKAGRNIRRSFSELNLAMTRLHDAPLENAGARLVDIPLIFANFHADETDPRNYYFRQTDDYIRNCVEGGTPVYYRLGTSIEHGFNKYFIAPPEDVDKWIDICDRVIRHYTEGWADGFHFRIRYWEIWNEPECTDADGVHLMWGGTVREYNEFYVRTATELKKRFPHLLFGGPAHCSYSQTSREFIRFCAEHHAPLDFYSYHCYSADPEGAIVESPAMARRDLDAAGYADTEIHLNEWHYFPGDWTRLRADAEYMERIYEEMRGLDSAAFLCTVMSLWQDTPLDMGGYYTATTTVWGIYNPDTDLPAKNYYGLKAFGEMVRYPERLEASSDTGGVTVLAGRGEDGTTALLISCFKTGPLELELKGWKPKRVFLLDDVRNLEEIKGDEISFRSDSAVLLAVADR